MSEANRKGGADTAAETYTKAEVDELLAEAQSNQDTAVAEARKEERQTGAKAERERISAILGSEDAKTRPALAQKLAFSDKGYSAEDAAEILQASAEESDGSKSDPLATAMQGKSPGISSDDGAPDTESEASEEEQAANFVLNA